MAIQTDADSNRTNEFIYRFLKTLRGSFLLSTVAVGVALFFIGIIFESSITITQQDRVLAGMFGVFGISAVTAGGSLYILLRIIHRR